MDTPTICAFMGKLNISFQWQHIAVIMIVGQAESTILQQVTCSTTKHSQPMSASCHTTILSTPQVTIT